MTTNDRIEKHQPIEVWKSFDGSWTWEVYKKYKKPEAERKNPHARWYCKVMSPMMPEGEFGDTYVRDITSNASMVGVA